MPFSTSASPEGGKGGCGQGLVLDYGISMVSWEKSIALRLEEFGLSTGCMFLAVCDLRQHALIF